MEMQLRGVVAVASPAPRRCVVVVQRSGDARVLSRSFASPEEALSLVREGASGSGEGFMWVDLQGSTEEEKRKVLQVVFPRMQPSQMEVVLAPDACDVIELQSAKAQYVVGCIACSRVQPTSTALEEEDGETAVLCTFACSERFLVTVHAAPFAGLAELLRHVEAGHAGRGSSHVDHTLHGASHAAMTGANILCTLVCFACEAFLPDPTALLSEVDNIDEMVLLIAPGQQDQTDLLRRVALLRRRIASLTREMYAKEKLLQELIAPMMRTTFVSRDPNVLGTYRNLLETHSKMLQRFEEARDSLNHANLNFVSAVSMRMSQASAGFDYRMVFISQIATICLPMNLLGSIMQMNCKVAWVADEYDTLVPFWSIIGIMLVWAVICLSMSFHSAWIKKD